MQEGLVVYKILKYFEFDKQFTLVGISNANHQKLLIWPGLIEKQYSVVGDRMSHYIASKRLKQTIS